jgi:hypothetical protein
MLNLSAQLITPFLTNNGSARCDLVASRIDANEAILATMEALQETRPNGRDYVGRPSEYEKDILIYAARFSALDTIRNALINEAMAINNA